MLAWKLFNLVIGKSTLESMMKLYIGKTIGRSERSYLFKQFG